MPDEMQVSPEELLTHADTVGDLAADVEQARAAAAHVQLGREAYGQLCQFLPGMFDETQSAAVDALTQAAAVLQEAATGLQDTAHDYEATDRAADSGLRRTGGHLP